MSKKLPRALSDPSQTTTPTQITTRKRKHISLSFEEGSEISSEKNELIEKKVKSEPLKWREIYQLISIMRKENPAPVDTMGCSELSDEESPPSVKRYQTLISLMLSSQTKDQITYQAMNKLKKHGLNIENIRKTEQSKLQELIYPVGFYVRKAQYIKEATEMLYEKYNSDIPKTAEELMKLKGVGPKMAYLCMTCAWGIVEGIGVDVHVHRISNRLQWVKTSTPEETRKSLESWLPYEYWDDINKLLVGFGQTICSPVSPKCQNCSINSLCPSAFVESKTPKRKKSIKNNNKNNNNNNNNNNDEYKEDIDGDDEDDFEEVKKPKRKTKQMKKSI